MLAALIYMIWRNKNSAICDSLIHTIGYTVKEVKYIVKHRISQIISPNVKEVNRSWFEELSSFVVWWACFPSLQVYPCVSFLVYAILLIIKKNLLDLINYNLLKFIETYQPQLITTYLNLVDLIKLKQKIEIILTYWT